MPPSRLVSAIVLLIASLTSSSGCTSSPRSSGESPDFNVIRLYNDSPAEIYDVELLAGGTLTSLDRLPAEHSPRSDRGVSPDPQTAEVSWRTADGRSPRAEVPVAPDMPAGFRGVVLLRLKSSGDVDVQFIPYRDLR